MRTAFVQTVNKLAQKDRNLWLLTGDLGFSVLEGFMKNFPKQYLNMGVAEQNMIGVAAGLALSGKTVFVYSIIPFVTLRPYEQIRNDICMQNANVKLVGVGEGFSYSQLGPTHHSIEDIAAMRSLPNMIVVCPGDPWEAEKATQAISKIKKPAYLRLGKKGEPRLHKKDAKFSIGKGILMEEGADLTILATGSMLENAVVVWKNLQKRGLAGRLISMHTIKPMDKELVIESAKKTRAIFTIEEHSLFGGLGSAVCEAAVSCESRHAKIKCFAAPDKIIKEAGSHEYLREAAGLSVNRITKEIRQYLKER